MIQNDHLKQSPITKLFSERYSVNVDKSYQEDDDYSRDNQNKSPFMKKFKSNQQTLRNKFKNYVDKQRHIFPKAFRKLNDSNFEEADEESNIRKVRREKQDLIQQMNRSQNESSYYMHRSRQFQKTCDILATKWRKVESIRKERKSELIKLQASIKAIKQQIKSQKLSFMKKIVSSKFSLTKSRIEFKERKLSQAKDVRAEKQLHRSKISSNKLVNFHQNQLKCQTVRESESKVPSIVNRLRQEKQEQAQQLKLSKLFRELTQREQVKIDTAKVIKKSSKQIERYRSRSLTLQEKIKEFRKSLAERRLNPIKRGKLGKRSRNYSYTEQNQYSTGELFEVNPASTSQSPSDAQ